jgi:hypothetical protein
MELSPRFPQSFCPIISVTAAHSRWVWLLRFMFFVLSTEILQQFHRTKRIFDVSLSIVYVHFDEWAARACLLCPYSNWRWTYQQMGIKGSQTHKRAV